MVVAWTRCFAPEYVQTRVVTPTIDVYASGVVNVGIGHGNGSGDCK